MTIILGIKLPNKLNNAVEFQKVLTDFNCIIKMRIGINYSSIFCSSTGIILLQIEDKPEALMLEKTILEISEIEIQRMVF